MGISETKALEHGHTIDVYKSTFRPMRFALSGGGDRMYAAPSFQRALDAAEQAATKAGDSYVTAERLLFGLIIAEGKASEILKKAGLTAQKLEQALALLKKQYTDAVKVFASIIEMRPGIKSGHSIYIAEK